MPISSSPNFFYQAEFRVNAKCWTSTLPLSFKLWRPKRRTAVSIFCKYVRGLIPPTGLKLGLKRHSLLQNWNYLRLGIRPYGKRVAATIADSSWEADCGQERTLSEQKFFQVQDESQMFKIGPLPGDLAEIEAFCRIFRVAEQLHTAIMNTLCNPDTGECTITYLSDLDDFASDNVEVLEEKVVAGLACMATLLQRGRQEVLAGRHSSMSSFHIMDKDIVDNKLPPLAIFRGQMKQCCAKLQTSLEAFFPPSDNKNTEIWKKLQRLKNVCYDAGFPRCERSPCHAVLPNWSAVNLYPGRAGRMGGNGEAAFWRGGQVTEEGLNWLLEKGYKFIVDLRAERVEDQQSLAAIEMAVSSGRIQRVHFPVEVGTAPTREQVEEFATLVSNNENTLIYLHSEEGVWRTSAMVSRWRKLVSRLGSRSLSKASGILQANFLPQQNRDSDRKDCSTPQVLDVPKPKDGMDSLTSGNGSFFQVQDKNNKLDEHVQAESFLCFDFGTGKDSRKIMGHAYESNKNHKSMQGMPAGQVGLCQQKSFMECNPFEMQMLQGNVLSRREMSKFFKNKKLAPKTFIESVRKRYRISSTPINSDSEENIKSNEIAGAAGRWGVSRQTISSTPSLSIDDVSICPDVATTEVQFLDGNKSNTIDVGTNGSLYVNKSGNGSSRDESLILTSGGSSPNTELQNKSVVSLSSDLPPDDNADLEPVNGNMCASTTGVVRVQSRKKAAMYLVRTDGFSCTRERVKESSLAFTHPSTQQQMLMWKTPPKTVLLLKKLGQELMEEAKQVASYLYYQEGMNVVVEPEVHDIFARIPGFGFVLTFYNQDTGSDLHERVDFVACLGGDGVILHASNLFRKAVPPIVSFNLGSLGFLTAHPFTDYETDLSAVIHGNNTTEGVYITLRMRLHCEIFRNGKAMPGKVFDVLNEVVVDRGSNPYLCKIECYEHNHLITKVQADGIIVATPTGSTAYSTSAGGSMVHPNVPCMLFTPICPHSLSFRPVILPDSAQLELKIPDDARSNAWVSFDGKRRQQLSKGDSVRIRMSEHPLPTVNKSDQTGDWFRSLVRCLNWNERLEQKALPS